MSDDEPDPASSAVKRRLWREFGIPAAVFLFAAAAILVATMTLRRSATPASTDAAMPEATWPPVPDSSALTLLIPLSAPLELHGVVDESRLDAAYVGTLTLDVAGLHFKVGDGSRVGPAEGWDRPMLLDSIVFAIAEPSPTGWRIAKQASAWAPTAGGFVLPDSFTVPGLRPVDLVDRWPVLVHHFRAENMPGEMRDVTFALQGRRDQFQPLLEEAVAATGAKLPARDTAGVGGAHIPLTGNMILLDVNPADGVHASYNAQLTLTETGLHYTSGGRLSEPYSADVHLDSIFVGRAGLESITFALAEPSPYGWRIVRQAEPWIVKHPSLRNGGGGSFSQLPDALEIPGVVPADLPGRWLVAVQGLVIMDEHTEERTHIQVIARGEPWTLSALLKPKPWEVQQ